MNPKSERRAPVSEDGLSSAFGIALAMEVCSDALDGITDPDLARRALSYLTRVHREEIERWMQHAADSAVSPFDARGPRGAAPARKWPG